MKNISKRAKILICMVIGMVAYLGSAIAFRDYKNDPDGSYYGANVPDSTTQTFDSEEQVVDFLLSAFEEKEPTFLDRVYAPAEVILRTVGL